MIRGSWDTLAVSEIDQIHSFAESAPVVSGAGGKICAVLMVSCWRRKEKTGVHEMERLFEDPARSVICRKQSPVESASSGAQL